VSGIAFVLPLKPGARARTEQLLAQGPPFDPRATGLDRYQVLLTDAEAIFVLDGPARGVESHVWAVGGAWDDVVAGPPRRGGTIYVWERIDRDDDISSAPTPGPGDSDGGDVFAP
jgi:hypothetical protein